MFTFLPIKYRYYLYSHYVENYMEIKVFDPFVDKDSYKMQCMKCQLGTVVNWADRRIEKR